MNTWTPRCPATKNSILLWRRAEEEIRKVESERPLEGEPSSRFLKKERLHPNISNGNERNQLTSHWQVEGSGSKSESLNKTQHSYLLKDTIVEVEAELLPMEGNPPSECWNLERNQIP